MSLPDGSPWPFYVILDHTGGMVPRNGRFHRHSTLVEAMAEAERLVQKTGKKFDVCRLMYRVEPEFVPVKTVMVNKQDPTWDEVKEIRRRQQEAA